MPKSTHSCSSTTSRTHKSSAPTPADAKDAQVRSALGSLVTLALQELKPKACQCEEVEDVFEDECRVLEAARLGLVGDCVALHYALDICAGPVELHWLTVETGAASLHQHRCGGYAYDRCHG
jgi:hypothetical protein